MLLVLVATGASLLLDASAKQTAGIVLVGLAAAWFVGSVAVRTLGIILSAIIFFIGLYVAALPMWNDRRTGLAAAQEYDAIVDKIREAAVQSEEYEIARKFAEGSNSAQGPPVPIQRKHFSLSTEPA